MSSQSVTQADRRDSSVPTVALPRPLSSAVRSVPPFTVAPAGQTRTRLGRASTQRRVLAFADAIGSLVALLVVLATLDQMPPLLVAVWPLLTVALFKLAGLYDRE